MCEPLENKARVWGMESLGEAAARIGAVAYESDIMAPDVRKAVDMERNCVARMVLGESIVRI